TSQKNSRLRITSASRCSARAAFAAKSLLPLCSHADSKRFISLRAAFSNSSKKSLVKNRFGRASALFLTKERHSTTTSVRAFRGTVQSAILHLMANLNEDLARA